MSDRGLWLSDAGLDRAAERRAAPGTLAEALADASTRVLVTSGDKVAADGEGLVGRPPERADADASPVWLGIDPSGVSWVSVAVPGATPGLADQPFEPGGEGELLGLRSLAARLTGWESTLASTAVTMQRWHRLHGFCPRCGATTDVADAGWRRTCTGCGADHFPRTDPVVIAGITSADGERFLLSRGKGWAPGRYSCPAGFVDAAESLEDAVRREMLEEVGLPVTDLRLVGNQVWPFNGQLMCAFEARACQDDITVDPHELDDARWVTREQLAEGLASGELRLPDRLAAGRWLVERWFGGPVHS